LLITKKNVKVIVQEGEPKQSFGSPGLRRQNSKFGRPVWLEFAKWCIGEEMAAQREISRDLQSSLKSST
jgi:hypothetical protein